MKLTAAEIYRPVAQNQSKWTLAQEIKYTCAVATGLVSALALVSWYVDLPFLRGLAAAQLQMKPNTAFSFLVLSVVILYFRESAQKTERLVSYALSALIVLMGALTLTEWISGISLGIDSVLIPNIANLDFDTYPGRMVAASAINFILKGTALLTLDWEVRPGVRPSQFLSLLSGLAPLQVLVAYSYGVDSILSVGHYPYITQMSPHTALCWLLVTMGTLSMRPNAGLMRAVFATTYSANLLRRLLALSVIVPIALAWATAIGGRENFYHPGFGSSLLVVLVIVMTLTIVWKSGHKVAVYEEALNLQAQKLKQSNEALEESASVISHDLKAPLQTATLVYNFLQEKYANSMEKEDRWMLEAAGRGISTMTQLIDRVLDYARAANTPANLHTVDLGQIVESVRFNLKFELDESKCDLKVSWLPEVWGDEVRLTQLYQNLIENALKYRGEKSCKVELGWEDRGRFILCFVADNGRGFLQSEATRIFQPFKRSSNVGEKGGSGIGLAVCKKIVEQHGGSIWSRSAPNQGATFYFTLLKRPGG